MKVAFAIWPFELDGLGDALAGQVFEIGGSAMMNDVQPELRSGSVSPVAYDDDRVGIHAMLYPQPFGIQAEWNWGRGPEYDRASQSILTRSEEHTSELQSLMRISYAVFCSKKKNTTTPPLS